MARKLDMARVAGTAAIAGAAACTPPARDDAARFDPAVIEQRLAACEHIATVQHQSCKLSRLYRCTPDGTGPAAREVVRYGEDGMERWESYLGPFQIQGTTVTPGNRRVIRVAYAPETPEFDPGAIGKITTYDAASTIESGEPGRPDGTMGGVVEMTALDPADAAIAGLSAPVARYSIEAAFDIAIGGMTGRLRSEAVEYYRPDLGVIGTVSTSTGVLTRRGGRQADIDDSADTRPLRVARPGDAGFATTRPTEDCAL